MNKLMILASVLLICYPQTAFAQETGRKVELSVAGSFQAIVGEYETEHYLTVPLRVGVYVIPQLSIEAEGIVTGWDEAMYGETEWGTVFSGNVAVHPVVRGSVRPFMLVGIGFSDSYPLLNSVALPVDEDLGTLTVLNLGAGFHSFFTDRVAIRTEYRMQQFSGTYTWGYDTYDPYTNTYTWAAYERNLDLTIHGVHIGISLFL